MRDRRWNYKAVSFLVIVFLVSVYPIRNSVERFKVARVDASASESATTNSQALLDMGDRFSCVVQDGGVQCWGRNAYGELGDGTTTTRSSAVSVVTSVSPSALLSGVTAIAVGRLHACALTNSGGVKCWGYNAYGQLGDGTTTNRSVAVDVSGLSSGVAAITAGRFHTCARLTSGGVKCWGHNAVGQLGTGNQADSLTPVSVLNMSDAVLIAAGEQHTCVSTSSGAMKCWGYGANYQLGTGNSNQQTSPANVIGLSASVSAISAGYLNTCAVLSTGEAECWGNQSNGQVGNGSPTGGNIASPSKVKLAGSSLTNVSVISTSHSGWTCAVTSSNRAYCWGGNFGYNLGAYYGGNSQTSAQEFTGLGTSVSAISLGEYHGCAMLLNSSLKCWGENGYGQVGNGTTTGDNGLFTSQIATPASVALADTTSPSFSSASVNATGTKVILTYSEALSATTAATSAFAVTVGGVSRSVSSVAVSGSTIELTLASAVGQSESVTVAYSDPTAGNDSSAVQDSAGNDAASLSATSVTNNSTVDLTSPTFVSAETSANGTTITLAYSEVLSATTAATSAFAVTVGGVSRSVSSVVVSGSSVVLTLASSVNSGESVTVAYSDPTAGNDANAVQDSAGNDAVSVGATSVTNNVPAPSTTTTSSTTPTTTTTIPATTSSTTSSTTTTTPATTSSTTSTTTTTIPAPISVTSTSTTTSTPVATTVPAAPSSGTTTTVARRSRSTTTTSVPRTNSTSTALTTSTTSLPVTTSSISTTTTTTPTISIPSASITSVAASSIQLLQQAEEKLKTVEAQTNAVTNDLRVAQIQVGEARIAVLDPKSALVVAVTTAANKVASLSASKASTAEIAEAVMQLEDLKIAIAQNVTISIENIATAQAKLAAVLSDPSASAEQLAEAKAELVSARVPAIEVVAAILNSVATEAHLSPVIIPGVVDTPGVGQIVFLDGSTEKNIEIVRINGSAIQMKSADGFTLNISTRDKNGQPVQFNSRGGIVVKHGNFISISGQGFAPGTVAKTWLFSSPRELGNLNVSSDGSFAAEFPITDDIHIGDHVAQVDGLSPDGQVRSLTLDVEILPSTGPAPYDPIANRLAIAALFAQAMALLALSKRREDGEGDGDDDREQADVSEVGLDQVAGGAGDLRDAYSPPIIRSIDRLLQQIPSRIALTQRLLARIVRDGVYLRALTGVGGVFVIFTGVIVGFLAVNSANFEAVSPSFGWLLVLIILGTFDALAGGMAALTIIAVTAISGGIDSTDAIRGLLGLAVLSFAIPLVASTTRPFRRASINAENRLWTRSGDVVLLALFGAWAAGAMYDALPGLYGFTSSAAGRTTTVQVVALTTLIVRFLLESVATKVTGNRLAYLAGPSLPEPSAGRNVIAILVRTGIMLFVAEAFIGNNIALWVGAAMYAIPKLTALVAHRFPKSEILKIWLPAGLLRTVVMLFVARWWASNISSFSEDPETQLQAAFVLLGIPSLVLTSLGWFAGGERKWRSTPISKVLGVVVLFIGVLTVRGVLFA